MNQNNFAQQPKIDYQSILFVSDLPHEITEEDLSIFFKNYHLTQAKIFKHKITYAHVYFENPDYAKKARKDLNGEVLTPKYGESKIGKAVRICKYEIKTQVAESIKDPSKSLIVKNLTSDVTSKDFYKMFEEFGEIVSSKLEVDHLGNSKNYGFVHFIDSKSADAAKQKLNGKVIKGNKLEVVNLIPLKSKYRACNIYVKNIPRDFTDMDLHELFAKYGDITSSAVSKDEKGFSRGFGYVCFSSDLDAAQAINELKEKNLSFPGLPPLYVNILMKREERDAQIKRRIDKYESPKFVARVMFDPSIQSDQDFERELRLFIKVILLQEYSPKNIETNFEAKFAVVTMNSLRDIEDFYKKYSEHCLYNYPKFYIEPYVEPKQVEEQLKSQNVASMGGMNPYGVMNQFANLSLNPSTAHFQPGVMLNEPNQFIVPNQNVANPVNFSNFSNRMPQMNIPRQFKNPQMPMARVHFGGVPNQQIFNNKMNPQFRNNNTFNQTDMNTQVPSQPKVENDSSLMEDVASLIYDEVEKKFSEDAGKITGMIVDLGLEEMRKLLVNRDKLSQVIIEAHEMLHKK